ncbi:MAG TPA: hypothetical protein VFR87_19690 [Nocardioidaceae bacterium]|nr:hypothetical protein [Nocardioidaceae bacterium]
MESRSGHARITFRPVEWRDYVRAARGANSVRKELPSEQIDSQNVADLVQYLGAAYP